MAKKIYNEIMGHDTEWIRAFFELFKLFKEAKPEHQLMVLYAPQRDEHPERRRQS